MGRGQYAALHSSFVTMATFIIGGILGYIDIASMSLWQHMYVIGVNHDKQLKNGILYFAMATGISDNY